MTSPLLDVLSHADSVLIKQGAEAKVYLATLHAGSPSISPQTVILKHRFPKAYRHPTLDVQLTKQRLTAEARSLVRAQKAGVPVPAIVCLDLEGGVLGLELIRGKSVREILGSSALGQDEPANAASVPQINGFHADIPEHELLRLVGRQIARLHRANIIHGDLTTSNMMYDYRNELVMIDFGLSYVSNVLEDKAVDLYVLERAFLSTHPDHEHPLVSNRFNTVRDAYADEAGATSWPALKKRFEEVRLRGRKRDMTG